MDTLEPIHPVDLGSQDSIIVELTPQQKLGELLQMFLGRIAGKRYPEALILTKQILIIDPKNTMISEYQDVLKKVIDKIGRQGGISGDGGSLDLLDNSEEEEEEEGDDDDDDDEDDDDDGSASSSSSSSEEESDEGSSDSHGYHHKEDSKLN